MKSQSEFSKCYQSAIKWGIWKSKTQCLCGFAGPHIHFLCSRPTKNHPLVHPKIDLPGREKNKPLSLFIAAILQHFLLYSTFSFRIQWPLRLSLPPSLFCLCSIQQSHLSLINQAFFLLSRLFSGLKRELGRAWEWDACEGDRGKKRSRTRRISLKFIWLCFMSFMFFFTRTLGWVWVGREQRVLNQFNP